MLATAAHEPMSDRINRMTDVEYDAERQRIRATYGDTKGEAGARFEQELSRLFAVAKGRGWNQEDLAKKEGKTQQLDLL